MTGLFWETVCVLDHLYGHEDVIQHEDQQAQTVSPKNPGTNWTTGSDRIVLGNCLCLLVLVLYHVFMTMQVWELCAPRLAWS